MTTGGANPADFNVNLSDCVVGGACLVDAAFAPLAGSIGRRSAKPAPLDGVPADRKLHDGRGLYMLIRANPDISRYRV